MHEAWHSEHVRLGGAPGGRLWLPSSNAARNKLILGDLNDPVGERELQWWLLFVPGFMPPLGRSAVNALRRFATASHPPASLQLLEKQNARLISVVRKKIQERASLRAQV